MKCERLRGGKTQPIGTQASHDQAQGAMPAERGPGQRRLWRFQAQQREEAPKKISNWE